MSTKELHWLAGLLQGEGGFMAGPPSSPRMTVISVHMTDEDVIVRVGRIFGRKPYEVRPRNPRWQASHQVRVTGGGAVRWMTALRPLMGARRQAQIDRALASYEPRSRVLLIDDTARAALDSLAAGTASGRSPHASASAIGASTTCVSGGRSST